MTTISTNSQAAQIDFSALKPVTLSDGRTFDFKNFDITPCVCRGGTPAEPAAPPMRATMGPSGAATLDLGDGYTLQINEHHSQFILTDAQGNKTNIWGDPHFNYNGQERGDFYETISLNLDNGVKITVNTTTWKHANGQDVNGMTLSSELVITKGDQGIVVRGMDQNQLGDLSIVNHEIGGRVLDRAHDDGLTLTENDRTASGWTSEVTGNDYSTDKWMATTWGAPVRERLEMDLGATEALTSWLTTGSLNLFNALLAPKSDETAVRGGQTGARAFAALPPIAAMRF